MSTDDFVPLSITTTASHNISEGTRFSMKDFGPNVLLQLEGMSFWPATDDASSSHSDAFAMRESSHHYESRRPLAERRGSASYQNPSFSPTNIDDYQATGYGYAGGLFKIDSYSHDTSLESSIDPTQEALDPTTLSHDPSWTNPHFGTMFSFPQGPPSDFGGSAASFESWTNPYLTGSLDSNLMNWQDAASTSGSAGTSLGVMPPPAHANYRKKVSTPATSRASKQRRVGTARYNCKHCGGTMTTRQNLKHHLHSHFGIKPFACSICGRPFRTRADTKRHAKTQHHDKLESFVVIPNEHQSQLFTPPS